MFRASASMDVRSVGIGGSFVYSMSQVRSGQKITIDLFYQRFVDKGTVDFADALFDGQPPDNPKSHAFASAVKHLRKRRRTPPEYDSPLPWPGL